MANIRTHYDNLKVSRDAPPEVIRAAYRSLSKKYHPDTNPNDPEAAWIMKLINVAYDVLSDPIKRKEHDAWITSVESSTVNTSATHTYPKNKSNQWTGFDSDLERMREKYKSEQSNKMHSETVRTSTKVSIDTVSPRLYYALAACILAVTFTYVGFQSGNNSDIPYTTPPGTIDTDQNSAAPITKQGPYEDTLGQAKPRFTYLQPSGFSALDPNGNPWPSKAGYIKYFSKLRTNGLSTVTVDNSQNQFNIFVKLVYLGGETAYPVRVLFIPAYQKYTINRVSPGRYDIRYRDLQSGNLFRTDDFSLTQETTEEETSYTNVSITLYKVEQGNMQTHEISENQF